MRTKVFGMRFLSVLAGLLLTLVMTLGMMTTVFAADSDEEEIAIGTAASGGVEVTTSFDKESYKSGETAVVTVSVKNTNDYDVQDVKVEYKLPRSFDLSDGEKKQKIDTLKAGETTSFEVSAIVSEDLNAEKVPEAESFFGKIGGKIGSVFAKDQGLSQTVETGIGIGVFVLAAVILVVIVLIVAKVLKKKGKKAPTAALALLLAGSVFAGSLQSGQVDVSAFTEDGMAEYWDYGHVSVHDPSIVKDPETGSYYIFGSHLAFAKTDDLFSWSMIKNNINTNYSTLFKEPWQWSMLGNNGTADVNLNGQMWAPDVIWNPNMNKWCMYMSIDGNNWCSSICLLTADDIDGPYEYQGIVVYSGADNNKTHADPSLTDVYQVLGENADLEPLASTGFSCVNAIDPSVKFDENGDLWMSYGSWSAGIYMLKLDKNTGFRDYTTTYETVRDESDAYYGKKLAGGYYMSGEASYIFKAGDYWYMFISYGGLTATGGYQMRVYRSENIDGPYYDEAGNSPICKDGGSEIKNSNIGVKIFGSYYMSGITRVEVAQGHNSAFVDDDGKIYLVYHTRFQSRDGKNETHSVRVHQMFVNEDGWLVAAPYEYCGETLPESAYETSEVVGEYDFIYQNPQQFYMVNGSENTQMGINNYSDKVLGNVSVIGETVVARRKARVTCKVSFSHEGGTKVVIHEDGTVTGDYSGTWKFTEGSNVEMDLNGVTYKGVFIQQRDEMPEKNLRMTFTLLGDNVTVWGVQSDNQLGLDTAIPKM